MIKECKKHQYIQLIGLLAMAKKYNQKLVDIVDAIQYVLDITPEDNQNCYGIGDPQHINDAVYCDEEADDLLNKMGIPFEGGLFKDSLV